MLRFKIAMELKAKWTRKLVALRNQAEAAAKSQTSSSKSSSAPSAAAATASGGDSKKNIQKTKARSAGSDAGTAAPAAEDASRSLPPDQLRQLLDEGIKFIVEKDTNSVFLNKVRHTPTTTRCMLWNCSGVPQQFDNPTHLQL